jgi:DNA-binding MarR family transcriptional regulator
MPHDREESLTLELLTAIEARSDVTQRHLADRLGVALGLANSYLKRCVRKGLVKITQAPANRYLYYLTPQGFTEKSRLTGQYLSASLDFYRRAGASVHATLELCAAADYGQVLLGGVSELAEIAAVRSLDMPVTLIGTFDHAVRARLYLGRPLWAAASLLPACDAVVLTSLTHAAEIRALLAASRPNLPLLVPDIVQPLFANSGAAEQGRT